MTVPYTFGSTPAGTSIPLSRLDDNFTALGSSINIDFLQSGAGATTRTLQSKAREILSVEDFGAIGNGVANDTAAFQSALNAASTNGIIFVPSATNYLVTFPLSYGGKNICWVCDGGTINGSAPNTVLTGTVIWGGVFYDNSSIAGNPSKFWYPDYFGNPGTGKVHKFNRIFAGVAANSSDNRPQTTTTWVNSYANVLADSQVASVSAIGGLAITGVSRTSDFTSWTGQAAGGAIALYGLSVNDETSLGGISAGLFVEAFHNVSVPGITEAAEFTPASNASFLREITPYDGIQSQATLGINISAGFRTSYTQKISAAIVVGGLANAGAATRFRKLIVAQADGIDTTLGAGGGGVAVELGTGMSIRWLNSSNVTEAEIFSKPSGLCINNKVAVGTSTPNTSAALDVTSTSGGILFPRMTTAQRDAISLPENGLVIYNTTTNKLQVRAASVWVDLH